MNRSVSVTKVITEECPLDICDGSGTLPDGEYDDIRETECPHVKETAGDEHLQDEE